MECPQKTCVCVLHTAIITYFIIKIYIFFYLSPNETDISNSIDTVYPVQKVTYLGSLHSLFACQ